MLDAMNSLQVGNGSFILRQNFKLIGTFNFENCCLFCSTSKYLYKIQDLVKLIDPIIAVKLVSIVS
jgi:hypothetical protein